MAGDRGLQGVRSLLPALRCHDAVPHSHGSQEGLQALGLLQDPHCAGVRHVPAHGLGRQFQQLEESGDVHGGRRQILKTSSLVLSSLLFIVAACCYCFLLLFCFGWLVGWLVFLLLFFAFDVFWAGVGGAIVVFVCLFCVCIFFFFLVCLLGFCLFLDMHETDS